LDCIMQIGLNKIVDDFWLIDFFLLTESDS
jgi:hypothetical protein